MTEEVSFYILPQMTLFKQRMLRSILLIFLSNISSAFCIVRKFFSSQWSSKNLCVVILLVTSFFNFSQKLLPKIVTCEEFVGKTGAINAYDIKTDSRGYLFIASDRGVYSFNGFDIIKDNFLYNNELTPYYEAIHKDYYGDLWFSGRSGVSYLEKDSLLTFPVPDSLLKLASTGFESIYRDKNGLVHLAPRFDGHYTLDAQGNSTKIVHKGEADINGYVVTQLEDGSWFHYSLHTEPWYESAISIYYLNDKKEFKKITETDEKILVYKSSLTEQADGTVSLSIGAKTLIRFKESELIEQKKFDFYIRKLFLDSKNDLWIGTIGNGVLQAKNSNLEDLTQYYKGDASVVTESYDGGLWFTSKEMGFGYLPPNSVKHYSAQNGYEKIRDVAVLNVVNEQICLSTKRAEIFFLNGNSLEQFAPPLNEYPAYSKEVCYDDKNDTYWLASSRVLYGTSKGKVTVLNLDSSRFASKKIICLKNIDGRIFGMTKTNFFEIKNNEIVNVSEKPKFGYLRDFTKDDKGVFWFATGKGIITLKGKKFEPLPYKVPDELTNDVSFVFFAHGSVWGMFFDQTVIKLDSKTFTKVVDQKNNPIQLWSYTIGANGDLWALNSNSKLIRIKKTMNWNKVKIESFETLKHYTQTGTQYQLAILNETIYLGSKHGLFELKIKDLRKESIPSKFAIQVFVNTKKEDFAKSYTLDYSENDLQFEFDAINFERRPLLFSFILEGYDTIWQETKYKLIHYTNLPPGEYRLKLRAKTEHGKWTQPEIITFEITPPFWQTWWFRFIVLFLILLLIFFVFRWRIKHVQRREKAKSKAALELARLEMRALKAQINPHFIFNSITSAMYYLAKNENKKVESYLQRFSKLVRGVLENSDKSVVRLMEEMELIRLYVKLESEQFEGEPILFDVNYNGPGLEGVNVPPTLFQPYIENAIQHGLRTKQGKRYIKLSFEIMEDELNIQIQDNGIGRVAAQKEKPFKDTKSFGMLISSRRIELLNEHKFSGVKVDDLYDDNGNASGTRVVFNIPFLNNDVSLNVAP